MKVGLKQGVLTLGLALLASATAFAQTAMHPHYIHARSDLAKARQLMQLPDATIVHPGHGPMTTIGRERETNPFLLPE